jgi:outer membrane protein TolC
VRAAIERGLREDPVLFSTAIQRDRGRLATLRAQLDRFSLKVDASLGEQWRTVKSFGDSTFTPTTGVAGSSSFNANLQVPLFSGFRVTANVRRAQHLEAAAVASRRATARAVAVDVLRSYWAVRRVELQAAVSEQALQRYRDGVTVVKARVSAGLAPPVDENRMETRRLREEARLADLRGTAAEARTQLAVALGMGGTELELTEKVDLPASPPASAAAADRLLAEATRHRGELQQARLQTLAARQQVRMVRSAFFPQLTAFALLQYGNNPYVMLSDPNPFANSSIGFSFGAMLSINLFDTLSTTTSLRDARHVVAQQEQEERRLGRLVEADVRAGHVRLVRLYRAREPLVKTVALARDTVSIIERRYKNGDATILDYLDAEFELLSSELELVGSSAAIALAWGELSAATGRLPGSAQWSER